MAFGEHLGQFFAHALAGDLVNFRRYFLDRRRRCSIDLVIESCSKAHSSKHAQLVFFKTTVGVADGADDSGFQIVLPAYEIQNLVRGRIEHHAVDGEIAAGAVFAGGFLDTDLVSMTAT